MSEPDVVIIGAGAAGLAASALLRRAGRDTLVLEAGDAIGGRARTIRPDALRGAPIDAGATWLHAVSRNPLVALARAAGDPLHPAHQGGRMLLLDGRQASSAEEQAYDDADLAWRACVAPALHGPDTTLSAASDACSADPAIAPWLANLEAWEGAIIAAMDADQLSLQDWDRNQLDGDDLRPACGVGTLLADRLGPDAGPMALGVRALRVDWSRPGIVSIDTDAGRLRARSCIVTVSTGVLRAGGVAFAPALPDDLLTALDGLPMGLLSKLALPAAGADRLGLSPGLLLEQRLAARGDPMMLLSAWPDDAPYVTGFLGGRHAWSFAGREADALEEAMARLESLLGPRVRTALSADGFVSHWGSDPLFLGAYSYARPGHADSRAALGRPFADGRLVLAGEACCADGLAGTVGGAMLDGERAARALLEGVLAE